MHLSIKSMSTTLSKIFQKEANSFPCKMNTEYMKVLMIKSGPSRNEREARV